jgi:hypothetical protein
MNVVNVTYPKVMWIDGQMILQFSDYIPENLMYFTKHPTIPGAFIPDFQPCQYRDTELRKANNCNRCGKQRKVWICKLKQIDVFPITCKGCNDAKAPE